MVLSLPLLSCQSSVSVTGNPDRKKLVAVLVLLHLIPVLGQILIFFNFHATTVLCATTGFVISNLIKESPLTASLRCQVWVMAYPERKLRTLKVYTHALLYWDIWEKISRIYFLKAHSQVWDNFWQLKGF